MGLLLNTRHCTECGDTDAAGLQGAPEMRTHAVTLEPSFHPEQWPLTQWLWNVVPGLSSVWVYS